VYTSQHIAGFAYTIPIISDWVIVLLQ